MPPGPPQPVGGAPGPWDLVLDSEFDGTSLPAQWSTGVEGIAGVTSPWNVLEQDCYDPAQVSVTGGALDLSATAEQEACTQPYAQGTEPYVTGTVTTDGLFSFTYGYVEARIWLPGGPDGVADWPAFWADGQAFSPAGGEIDIVEGLRRSRPSGRLAGLHRPTEVSRSSSGRLKGFAIRYWM